MDPLHVILRVIHIGAGIFWVGSAAFMLVFMEPTVHALGPQAGPVMAHMNQKLKLPVIISISAVLTVTADIWLYWRDTNGFDPDIITTPVGLAFTVGGIAAIVAFAIGLGVVRPRVKRLGSLGGAMASGAPTQEQVREMGELQRTLRSISIFNMVLLSIAVVAMASARFL